MKQVLSGLQHSFIFWAPSSQSHRTLRKKWALTSARTSILTSTPFRRGGRRPAGSRAMGGAGGRGRKAGVASAGSTEREGARRGDGEGLEGGREGEGGEVRGSSEVDRDDSAGVDSSRGGRRLLEYAKVEDGRQEGVEEASLRFGVPGRLSGRRLLSASEEDDFWAACDAVNRGNCR